MEQLIGLFLVYIVYLGALIVPGPDLLIVLRNTLSHSARAGVFSALGVATGQVLHITYSLAGIGLLISQSIIAFNVIKWLGAGYLIYMGYNALRSKGISLKALQKNAPLKGEKEITKSSKKAYVSGLIANILNPKATLFFVALFSQMIDPALSVQAQMLFGFICMATAFIWFSFVALALGITPVRQAYSHISQRIERIFGVLFITLGVKLALSR